MSKVVTTIKIEDKILKDAKKLAIDRGVTFSKILETALKSEIEKKVNNIKEKS